MDKKTLDKLLLQFNTLQDRILKGKEYMDKPLHENWEGEKLKKGIEEREKYIPALQKICKEQAGCLRKLSQL